MIRPVAMALLIACLASAPAAAADPYDLLPDCAGGQAPEPGVCAVGEAEFAEELAPEGAFVFPGFFPGANPGVPPGPTPFNFPIALPLGVTPFNIPSNLPLGPTPPTRPPFAP